MKNNIKKLCILSLLLLVISIIVILALGKTYTAIFEVTNNNYKVMIENKNNIEVLKEERKSNTYSIKVKGLKPGKTYITLNYGDYEQSIILYIHKTLVITENTFFGKSTGSEVIPISISIILLYLLYILINKYKCLKKENLYQYKNITYLGLIIFISMFAVTNTLSIFNYYGLYKTINSVIESTSNVSMILFPLVLITFILVTISNIQLIRKEGKNLRNLLGLFLGILICISTILPDFIYRLLTKWQIVNIYNLNSIGPYTYNFIESLIYLFISYLECLLIGTIIIAIKAVKKKVDYNKDYMIILGCKIREDGTLTPLLKGRVDKALEFRNNQLKETKKDLIFIPSGGKGQDEVISEAEAMKNYLLDKGINKKNILVENKSTNTYENIKFSNKLIKNKDSKIAFSTTNYHVLRAGLLATEQGLKMEGIGSKTKTYFWINAFIREFIGTLYAEKKKHITVFIVLAVLLLFMIAITYLANNI